MGTIVNCPKACGECCKVVIITNRRKISLQERWSRNKSPEHEFFLAHLTEITKEEAIGIRPVLAEAQILWRGVKFFICDLYDYKSNKCRGYESWRPPMCTKFPFYDRVVLNADCFRTVPECYFTNQIMKVDLNPQQIEVMKLIKEGQCSKTG